MGVCVHDGEALASPPQRELDRADDKPVVALVERFFPLYENWRAANAALKQACRETEPRFGGASLSSPRPDEYRRG